ncbi:hypothetical protein AGOR_G00231550 [Albula goreensis]|uniref:PDZ domain-containing protein n=1 Tax=Albula goreensis TaxID=1534307 RepID=A0A8T3CLJ5_9TELE|nr:hypothetical protein AGOR_G00231550 [Albula goreensis]
MRSASMGTGEYICITVRGGAPWGFSLQGEGEDPHEPRRVSQVDEGGQAALAGLCEGDEVVSLNGKSCVGLTLPETMALMDAATNSLRLLVKRHRAPDPLGPDAETAYFGAREPVGEGLESTTLQIWPSRELYISEPEDKAYCRGVESNTTQLSFPLSAGGPRGGTFPPGSLVELQLALSHHTLEGEQAEGTRGVLATESGRGYELDARPAKTEFRSTASSVTSTTALYIPRHDREPLGQRGEVEVTLPGSLRHWQGEEVAGEAGGSGRFESQGGGGGGGRGGSSKVPPTCVSFTLEASSEGVEPVDEWEWDSESEGDDIKPNKHRARHARLRRSESQSEKQVKEAKSKCKRIALLLTAAPNPNNKGVLMFKKHRQRAKKYTLVSYGTGENEPEEDDDDEDEEESKAVQFTFLAAGDSELDEDFLANAQGRGHILTLDWDTGLLEIEKKLDNGEDMECLPETKGKGALMFAQRRQRVDEITAEHEEMRSKGLPVESVQEAQIPQISKHTSYQMEERSYMQSTGAHHQVEDVQRSVTTNVTAKPFSAVQNRVPAPFTPPQTSQQAWTADAGPGEQIASRDERISVPAIKTGILQDTRRRIVGKPMFTFKEAPKVSPNPELLNLLNRHDRKPGLEYSPEEDYLSLGAEACNFLQPSGMKTKIPPPVAPKPTINPASPPWSSQIENSTQPPSQPVQNEAAVSAEALAEAPALTEAPPPSEVPASNEGPAPDDAPPAAPPQAPEKSPSPQQHATVSSWSPPEAQAQPQPPQPDAQGPPQNQEPPQQQQPATPQPQTSPDPQPAWPSPPPQQSQPTVSTWVAPQPYQAPASAIAPAQNHTATYQPVKPWNQPEQAPYANSAGPPPPPPRRMNSYTAPPAPKALPASPVGSAGTAFEMPALKGRGAELFAKRQSRMERYVVDSATVQANKARAQSPTPSLPNSWKYSPNVRAPPPLAYNPIHSPSYPPWSYEAGSFVQHFLKG